MNFHYGHRWASDNIYLETDSVKRLTRYTSISILHLTSSMYCFQRYGFCSSLFTSKADRFIIFTLLLNSFHTHTDSALMSNILELKIERNKKMLSVKRIIRHKNRSIQRKSGSINMNMIVSPSL